MKREKQSCFQQESHGDWLATEHNSAVANNLKQKYGEQMLVVVKLITVINTTFAGVSGIPCLVVCKKDGTLVTKDGRAGVTSMVIMTYDFVNMMMGI